MNNTTMTTQYAVKHIKNTITDTVFALTNGITHGIKKILTGKSYAFDCVFTVGIEIDTGNTAVIVNDMYAGNPAELDAALNMMRSRL